MLEAAVFHARVPCGSHTAYHLCGGRPLHGLALHGLALRRPAIGAGRPAPSEAALLTAAAQLTALLLSSSLSASLACASLPSAAANGLPLLGRFEPLKGAASFIGTWQLGGPESAGPRGMLSLLRRIRTPN